MEKLGIECMEMLFNILENNKSFKSIELERSQCNQIWEFVDNLQKENEKLKARELELLGRCETLRKACNVIKENT